MGLQRGFDEIEVTADGGRCAFAALGAGGWTSRLSRCSRNVSSRRRRSCSSKMTLASVTQAAWERGRRTYQSTCRGSSSVP
jgi:hypothetical protein